MGFFYALTVRNVHHGSDHAHRFSTAVNNESSGMYAGVAAVGPAQAIFGAIRPPAVFDQGPQACDRAVLVIHMNERYPARKIQFSVPRCSEEYGAVLIAPEDVVFDVPVEDDITGRLQHKLKQLV